MKRALAVKSLTGQIILVRLDSGDLLSLSVPCRTITPGTLLSLDDEPGACPVHSVDGKNCKSICHRQDYVMYIEHRIEHNDKDYSAITLKNRDTDHYAV